MSVRATGDAIDAPHPELFLSVSRHVRKGFSVDTRTSPAAATTTPRTECPQPSVSIHRQEGVIVDQTISLGPIQFEEHGTLLTPRWTRLRQ